MTLCSILGVEEKLILYIVHNSAPYFKLKCGQEEI